MGIRTKNLDLQTRGMKRNQEVFLGNISASENRMIFVAPIACEINEINLYCLNAHTFNDSQSMTITAHIAGAASSTLGAFDTALSANAKNVLSTVISSHNSLSEGAALAINISATCQTLSGAVIHVLYTPLLHKENR